MPRYFAATNEPSLLLDAIQQHAVCIVQIGALIKLRYVRVEYANGLASETVNWRAGGAS